MIKRITMLLLFLSLPSLLLAQGRIKGKVTDLETGEPLIGANVLVVGTSYGAATDVNGEYLIINLSAGTVEVKCSYIGYQTITQSDVRVTTGLTNELDFQLPAEGVSVADVIVTAERPMIQTDNTNKIRTTTSDDRDVLPVRGVDNIISLTAGVVQESNAIFIRGGRQDEVGFYLEGANIKNPELGGRAVTIPQDALEEIQVQAGGYTAELLVHGVDRSRPAGAQVLRGRNGSEPEPRNYRELPNLPETGPRRVSQDGGRVRLDCHGRDAVGPPPAGHRAASGTGQGLPGPFPQEVRSVSPKYTYGTALAGVDLSKLSGTLIVIEGPDSSGRSTQIALLAQWLEEQGHAVAQVGLRRSNLVGPELERAKQGNILSPRTLSLFYATDFYDQLENGIVPALRAGFVVLADRYIYTLMARAIVRGAEPDWVASVYSMAIVPDAVFYLTASLATLVQRTFQAHSELDYWESGMDCGLSRDWLPELCALPAENPERVLQDAEEVCSPRAAAPGATRRCV